MFRQGHLNQDSFPQIQFQMPAPNVNEQCIHVYKQENKTYTRLTCMSYFDGFSVTVSTIYCFNPKFVYFLCENVR